MQMKSEVYGLEEELKKQKIQTWYKEYSDGIYRFILIMIGDHEQAKDLTQDTFIKAYHHLDYFKGKTSDKNWLYRIARTVTIDFMRKRKPIRYMFDSINGIPAKDPSRKKLSN